jgi:hypothetical protein
MATARLIRFRFSLLALLIAVTCASVIAAWIARGERQRRAVVELRKLDEYENVFHSFYGKGGPCADVLGPEYEPPRLARKIGLDYFYDVTIVFIDAARLDEAMPHLACLPGLREVYVSANLADNSDAARVARADRIEAAIARLKREFPRVTVEQHPSCPLEVSKVPVVG